MHSKKKSRKVKTTYTLEQREQYFIMMIHRGIRKNLTVSNTKSTWLLEQITRVKDRKAAVGTCNEANKCVLVYADHIG